MEKIRVLIVDDEPLAREGIRMRLAQAADLEVIGECGNGKQAIAAIQREVPDLIFLDIQMPKLDGFGVLQAVGAERMPYVIFITAYDEYALRAFAVHALDYLLKPIDGARFSAALERARKLILATGVDSLNEQLRALLADLKAKDQYLTRLAIKGGKASKAGITANRIVFLKVDEIDWIEAADNYVKIHAGKEAYLLHTTLSSLEQRLNPNTFLRIHRSTIINVHRIQELHPLFHGDYQIRLKDGTQVTSGRSYREKLQRLLENDV